MINDPMHTRILDLFSFSRTGVRLGEWDTSSENDCENDYCSDAPVNVPISRIISHNNYNPNSRAQENDIALIRLSSKVTYTGWI